MDQNVYKMAQDIKLKEFFKNMRRWGFTIVVVLLAIILLSNSFYIVQEAEQAVITRFGVMKEIILAPQNDFLERNPTLVSNENSNLKNVTIKNQRGLLFKIPFITDVTIYNARLITYVSSTEVVNTADKKQYHLTIFAQWTVANPGLFSISVRNMQLAESYLDGIVFPTVVQNVNRLNADDFISNKDMLNEVLSKALTDINTQVADSGIELKDIQVYRTSLPKANLETTYSRMVADRAKVAQQLRSEGQEEYQKAVSSADLDARIIESSAVKESSQIKGEGDAKAMRIYADAYGVDTEFYTYWRSLEALKTSFENGTTLILDKDHPLWAPLLDWAGAKIQ